MTAPVMLFYSYSRKDEDLREELDGHLKILQRRGMLQSWHDRKIEAGETWGKEIDEHLRNAELVLLLVSKDFVASDYIWSKELNIAMQRHDTGEARVVPILVRAVDLQPDDAPFMKLQGLPTDLRPVTSWPIRDEAWTNVAKGIRAMVKDIQSHRNKALFAPRMSSRQAFEPFEDIVAPEDDPLLRRVVDAVAGQIEQANIAKGGGQIDAALIKCQAQTLIDTYNQKRVLWVDDRPEGNQFEIAALSKLQIEILIARSTDEAMDRMAVDTEGFDLVISDWDRSGELPKPGSSCCGVCDVRIRPCPLFTTTPASYPNTARRVPNKPKTRAHSARPSVPGELLGLVVKALSA